MGSYHTVFGSLDHYEKGGVQVIDDDPKITQMLRRALIRVLCLDDLDELFVGVHAAHALAPGVRVRRQRVLHRGVVLCLLRHRRDVAEHPQVRSVIWFDVTKESDWRLQPASRAAKPSSAESQAR